MRKNKTLLPSMRDALWYGDGTKLNLYYKEYVQGVGLVKKTTMVYEVIALKITAAHGLLMTWKNILKTVPLI